MCQFWTDTLLFVTLLVSFQRMSAESAIRGLCRRIQCGVGAAPAGASGLRRVRTASEAGAALRREGVVGYVGGVEGIDLRAVGGDVGTVS